MEAVENQRQVYHRSLRPWKSLQDFHTPAAQRLLINKTKRKPADVSPINHRPVCLSLGVHRRKTGDKKPVTKPVTDKTGQNR
jgi:hypothetical protein